MNFVDLSKRKPSRIQHHVQLGPDCPDRFPKSRLEFHGAGDEREQLRKQRSGTHANAGECTEVPSPRCILDKQIAEAERRSKSQPQRNTKCKESSAHPNNSTMTRTVNNFGREILISTDTAHRTNNATNGREAATRSSKRFFPQKPDTSLQVKSRHFDDDYQEKNTSKEYPVIERSSHSANKVYEEYDCFLRKEQSQLVPGLNQKNLDRSKESQLLDDWVNKICPRKEVPCIEQRKYPNDAWQKCLDVISISEVAEKKIVLSVQPQKQFPSNSLESLHQSRAAAQLHQRYAWNSDDLSVESSGHVKTRFSDNNNQTSYIDHAYSNEIANNFGNRHEMQSQHWGNNIYATNHNQSSATEKMSSLTDIDCTDEFQRSLPKFADSVPSGRQVDALKTVQQCFQSIEFPLDKFSNFDDDSEEDRFRQAIFKQKSSQQLALDVKNISNLDFEDEVTRVSQVSTTSCSKLSPFFDDSKYFLVTHCYPLELYLTTV